MPGRGTFVLADISGYSQYLDEAGLQHASKVTAKLLNTLIKASPRSWQVANLEGDCIFFYCEGREPPSELISHLRGLFERFFMRVLDLGQDTDCGCGACGGANQLALKFIIHAGEYAEQTIGGRCELMGPDVVTAHRLLKNDTGMSEYILMTRAYLGNENLSEYEASDGVVQTESGSIPFVVIDLTSARREAESKKQTFVSDHGAMARWEVEIAAPASAVWDSILDPEKIRQWSGAREIFDFPARMGAVGTVHRFILPDGHDFVQVVIAIDHENRRVTFRRAHIPFSRYVYSTYYVSDRGNGVTILRCHVGADRSLPMLPPLLGGRRLKAEIEGGLERLKAYCETGGSLRHGAGDAGARDVS